MNTFALAISNILAVHKPKPVIDDTLKKCRKCEEIKPRDAFYTKSNGQLNHVCLACSPNPTTKWRDYSNRKRAHNKKCEGCGKDFTTTNGTKKSCSARCAAKVHSQKARERHRANKEKLNAGEGRGEDHRLTE